MITKNLTSSESLNKIKILTNILIINAVVFYKLSFRKNKAIDIKCYSMTIFKINDVLSIYRVQNNLKTFSVKVKKMSETFIKKFSLKEIEAKLHLDFCDLL